MSRSFSNVKNVSAFVANEISRRGYSAASQPQGVVSSAVRVGAPKMMLKKGTEESGDISWVPDPVTGYYRPENLAKEVDPAELREMLLKSKTGRQ
ncbi:hypothetical protein ACS0TY_007849 [Phlomoides rotata]